jgi:galactokinase
MTMASLSSKARTAFFNAYRCDAQRVVQAPGRVNLIGEHTDYNDGFVLPCAIDRATVVALSPRRDRRVRALALDWSCQQDEFDLREPIVRHPSMAWANYVRGMVLQLLKAHPSLPGMDLAITGNVPQGAGLSSSASLQVALGAAFRAAGALAGVDSVDLALMAQRAENEFVGCQCGIMDQLVSACGVAGHALLIDCRSLTCLPVRMPEGTAVLIAHSMVERGLVDSLYNERRQMCEQAARHLGVAALRDAQLDQLEAARLPDVLHRRARHVITENERTLQTAQALEAGDLRRVSQLMAGSHRSMRDDFEITVPAVDQLVGVIGEAMGGEGGCRMTGGGFGGCVVALMPSELVPTVMRAIERGYRSPQDLSAAVFVCQPSAGAGAVALE